MIHTKRNIDGIVEKTGNIINLTEVPTDEVLYLAEGTESVKVKIHHITSCTGPTVIPVRFVDSYIMPIEVLEELVEYGVNTKTEYRALEKISRIMNEKKFIFSHEDLQRMTRETLLSN